MDKVTGSLQVFFEEPFWVGVFERIQDGRLSACKVTFGAEPKDYEVLEFIQLNYYYLSFSLVIDSSLAKRERMNHKRMQREVKKQLKQVGIGTKSQQVLKLQQEENKMARISRSREQKEEEQKRQFAIKQQKRKKKHRGR